ncbi:hypothetical protein [Yoonia sp. BS5-3]|uniref:Uncharacterized protein n=1 Tax=Yoonia phaeophyticola TaxID=3137369 RepID=A0ABZ2V466_9RHOB
MGNDAIGAFEKFLQWGPIGLAGLMLVLVIFAMVTSELTKLRAMLLSFFMLIGAGCFGAALYFDSMDRGGNHNLVLSVLPNDVEQSGYPPPSIKINGQEVSRDEALYISGTTILQVDVNSAIIALRQAEEKVEEAAAIASETRQDLEAATAATRTLEREIATKTTELARADRAIAQQQVALEDAQEAGVALATQVRELTLRIDDMDRDALAPVERDLLVIERQLEFFNNQLVIPAQP